MYSLQLGVKQPNFRPLSHLAWTSPNVKSRCMLSVLNDSAKIDGNVKRQADGANTALTAKLRLRCYSGRQWQEDTHSFSSCPPTLPRMLPSSSPSAFVIFFPLLHQCGTSQIHRAVSFFFSQRSLFSPPPLFPSHPSSPPPHLPQPPSGLPPLLTRSSDCTVPHLHSFGGSSSCTRACPGSCCGCCALYSRWAPFRSGKVARIRWASGTVVGGRRRGRP